MTKTIFKSVLLLIAATSMSWSDEETDTDVVRLDKDVQLLVPENIAAEVKQYLRERYEKPEVLKTFAPDARFDQAVEDFTDVYYDTTNLTLLEQDGEIRHRRRYANGAKIKEWIQIKFPHADVNATEEIKFKVNKDIADKQSSYGHETAYPFLSILKSNDYEAASNLFGTKFKTAPDAIKPTATIRQTRSRVYVKKGENTMFTFTVDEVRSERWWAKAHFFQLEIEANEILYSEADASEKKRMTQLQEAGKQDLLTKFPQLQQVQAPKYRKVFEAWAAKIPALKTWYKLGLI